MSFNFEPQEKYLAWVPQGKAMFFQYGLCGQEIEFEVHDVPSGWTVPYIKINSAKLFD